MEVEILKEALDLARAKKPTLPLVSGTIRGSVRHEGRFRRARRRSLQSRRAPDQAGSATRSLPQAGGRCSPAHHPRDRRCAPDLRIPAHHGAREQDTTGQERADHQQQARAEDHARERADAGPAHRPSSGRTTTAWWWRCANVRWCSDHLELHRATAAWCGCCLPSTPATAR